MNHAEFIADYTANNMPASTGGRARKSQQPADVVAQQAEAAWLVYNTPNKVLARALEAAGGSYWASADLSKKRVYFNAIEFSRDLKTTVYFDILGGTWHDQYGAVMSVDAEAAARAIIRA